MEVNPGDRIDRGPLNTLIDEAMEVIRGKPAAQDDENVEVQRAEQDTDLGEEDIDESAG